MPNERLAHVLAFRLTDSEYNELKALALKSEIYTGSLVRRFVLQGLHSEAHTAALAASNATRLAQIAGPRA